jgi:aminopeptidase-like protein
LSLLRPERLVHSLAVLQRIIATIEGDGFYHSRNPKGNRSSVGAGFSGRWAANAQLAMDQMALLWVSNLADRRHSLLDMANRAGVPFATIRTAADALVAAELLEPVPAQG